MSGSSGFETAKSLDGESLTLTPDPASTCEDTPGDQSNNGPYRGNFFRRFSEIRAVHEGIAVEEQVFYIRMVKERFGLDLLSFYEEQRELCDAICDALSPEQQSDKLVAAPGIVVQATEATPLPEAVDEIGGDADYSPDDSYPWDEVNPLLEQAYALLDSRTLNAPFLAK